MTLDRKQQPIITEPKDIKIPYPERDVLPNGIPLQIIRMDNQEVIRLDIIIRGGRRQQDKMLQSIFTNRMLREGTTKYDSRTIAERLDFYGAWLELSSAINYSYITLFSLKKFFKQTLDIIYSMLIEPTFPEDRLENVLTNNLQNFKVNSTKVEYLARKELNRVLFGEHHPYGKAAAEQDYKNITATDLKDFFQKFYNSRNCMVSATGKVDDEVISLLKEYLGYQQFGSDQVTSLHDDFSIALSPDKRTFIEKKDSMQSAVKMGIPSVAIDHPDAMDLKVLMTLFGGYFGSRLMSNIREEKGYTYGIYAALQCFKDEGVILVSTEADNRYAQPIVDEVYHEITRLHTEKVSEQELSMVKSYMIGEMCRSYENLFSLADAWNMIQTMQLGDDFFERSLNAVKNITPDDIMRLSKCYLRVDDFREVIVGQSV